MEKKEIVFFTDLEGTILRETDGEVNQRGFMLLLSELAKLQKNLNGKVKINIVSPIPMKKMKEIIDLLDNLIVKYSMDKSNRLDLINSAVAFQDDEYIREDYRYDVIEPFPLTNGDGGERGKEKYVKAWMEEYKNAELYIYAGNGRNDILAMKKIKTSPRGIVICPDNSRTEVKKIADYVSKNEDILGIVEGLRKINAKYLVKDDFDR